MYLLPKYIDVLSDTQRSTSILQTITNQITADKPYLVVHGGDVVDDCTSSGWVTFHQVSDYLLSNTRYYAALGNNDLSCSQFNAQFGTSYYQSFDVDNIHYIILNTNTSLASGSTQYNWLSNDLTNQPADTKFTLVFFHHPPFSVGGLADAIALFEANGVDAVFNGHAHLYARMQTNGIYYFIVGGGATPLSSCPVDSYTTCDSTNHHARILLDNGQLEVRVYDLNNTLVDSVDITGV
jgi:predicted phosphodiesterase